MANEGDLGNDAAQRNLDAALNKHRFIKQNYSEFCIDCGNHIPMARQEATGGCDRCAECKANEEHLGRHYR
jgi:RNA polymerase-binding transcription factor DksA